MKPPLTIRERTALKWAQSILLREELKGFVEDRPQPIFDVEDHSNEVALPQLAANTIDRILKALDESSVRNQIAFDVLVHLLIHHPLPWKMQSDSSFEVISSDGAIITKCASYAQASAFIAEGEKVFAEIAGYYKEQH